MRKIDDYENKMIHNGKRNERFVYINCLHCGEFNWKKWNSRIKRGDNIFCDKDCYNDYQRANVQHVGYENARLNLDKSRGIWYAYWWEDGKLTSTTGAKWLWEQEYGPVPKGYVVTYKDRNPENCVLENLELVTRGERTSEALMGHKLSYETKKKISIAHTGAKKWRGFSEPGQYPGLSKRRKSDVKERDNYECQICEEALHYSRRARVHHIDGDKTNQDWDNLILVCISCHALIHSRKKVPEDILAFRSMLKY